MKIKGPIGIAAANIYLHFPCITEDEADDLDEFLEEEHIEYEGATDVVIDLEQQCQKQKETIDKLELENKVLKEQMVAMVKPNYTYGVR